MDLDEMKKKVKGVATPALESGTGSRRNVDDLVASLKIEDAKDRRRMRQATIFFVVAGILYTAMFGLTWFAPPDDSPALHRSILSLFAMVFLSAGLYGRMKGRELAATDYAAPVQTFLAKAGERYRFVNMKQIAVIIPYLLVLSVTGTVALMTGMKRYFPDVDPSVWLIVCGVGFPVLWIVAFALAWRTWKRDKEPLLEEIMGMEEGLRGGND